MVDFSITGRKRSLESVAIRESEQTHLKEEMEAGQTQRTLDSLESFESRPYSALDIENQLMDMVMRGDVAAIRGGMDPTASLTLSDAFIQKCELMDDPRDIVQLNYRVILDYAERVAQIRLGQNPSPLVIKVANYVQQHLSEAIKVEDIAQALFMGRSRLSTNFKKETGMDLSEYITLMKINEAKRMLRYSDKTFATISLYLGFSSQNHFTRVFKKFTEMTPLEYRQAHKHY